MAIKSIDLAWITVADLEKSKKFFKDVLGLDLYECQEEFGWAELKGKQGGSALGLGQSQPSQEGNLKPGSNAVMTFTVDDIEKTIAELKSKGVVFVGDLCEVPGGPKLMMFKDLDGNLFQLVQM